MKRLILLVVLLGVIATFGSGCFSVKAGGSDQKSWADGCGNHERHRSWEWMGPFDFLARLFGSVSMNAEFDCRPARQMTIVDQEPVYYFNGRCYKGAVPMPVYDTPQPRPSCHGWR